MAVARVTTTAGRTSGPRSTSQTSPRAITVRRWRQARGRHRASRSHRR
jgi:hypothetical protein